MNVQGKLYEISNLERFIESYLANPNNPDPTTISPISEASIQVGSIISNQVPGFFPNIAAKTKTTVNGTFNVDCSALPSTHPVYLLAFRKHEIVNTIGMSIPIYRPLYRSESFVTNNIDSSIKNIYVFEDESPNSQGITQEDLNTQIEESKTNLPDELDSLSAYIAHDGIRVTGKGGGATITFRIVLSPSTSHDLDDYIKHKIKDFDINLPGWDWMTTLCVDEDEIEVGVRKGVKGIISPFNQHIHDGVIDQIANNTGVNSVLVSELFNDNVSMIFSKVRYPLIEVRNFGVIPIPIRAIVPDPCLGLPKKLYP